MSVYVDQERNGFRRMVMCHMLADTLAELHAMADKIGMKREWFEPFSFPHYDVAQGRRAEAVKHGAIQIDRQATAALMKRLRHDAGFIQDWKDAIRPPHNPTPNTGETE